MRKNYILLLALAASGLHAQSSVQIIDSYLKNQTVDVNNKKASSQFSNLEYAVVNENVIGDNVADYVKIQQVVNNIPVYQSFGTFQVKDKKVLSFNNNFKLDNANSPKAGLTAKQAIEKYAGKVAKKLVVVKDLENYKHYSQTSKSDNNSILFADKDELLNYYQSENGLKLAWIMLAAMPDVNSKAEKIPLYEVVIDANTGDLLSRASVVSDCSFDAVARKNNTVIKNNPEDYKWIYDGYKESNVASNSGTYRVIPANYESPLKHSFELVTNADDPVASKEGWHKLLNVPRNPEASMPLTPYHTLGNNARVSSDTEGTASDLIIGSGGILASLALLELKEEAYGGQNLLFDFPNPGASIDYNPVAFANASTTQMFYSINSIHDILHYHGFNPKAGSFQANSGEGYLTTGITVAGLGKEHRTVNNAFMIYNINMFKAPITCFFTFETTKEGAGVLDVIRYATSSCNLGNSYGQVEDYTINIVNPQGCDSAVNGSNLSNAFVPKNIDDYQTITASAKTGAYTDVFVMEGMTYDFKVSKTGVYSTIKDASTGTTYRTATESEFSWLSSVTGYIRWYTHAGEDCSADNSTFTESIKSSLQTNPLEAECSTGTPSVKGYFSLENGGANAQELAFDIPMIQNKTTTIKGINLTMADNATSINFEELNDNNGLPGSHVSTINGTIESKVFAYQRDGKSFYNYKVIFDKSIITDINLGARKWLKLVTDASYVEVNPIFSIEKNIAYKNTNNTDWQISNDYELVYQLIAECQQDMCNQVVIAGDDPNDGTVTGPMLMLSYGAVTQSFDIVVEPNKQLKVDGVELDLALLSANTDVDATRILDINLRAHDATLGEPGSVLSAKLPYTFTRELVEEMPLDPTISFYRFKVKVLFDQPLILDGSQSTTYWLELASDYYATMSTVEVSKFIGMPAFAKYLDAFVPQDNEIAYKLLTDCSVLETQNPIKQEKTKLYPVPFANTLTVSSATQIRTIEIFNLAGAKTLQKEVNQSKIDLELSALPVGIYIVKTTDINGKVDVQKVIKK